VASLVRALIDRRITVRLVTAAAVVAVQVVLTIACILALRQNGTLREQAATYLMWAAPSVGRNVPAIEGIDWKGVRQIVEYNQDHRPTLVYTVSKDCPHCQVNWTAMRSIQALSPARLRLVYIDTVDQLTESYVREHGMAQDIVFSRLDPSSATHYEMRGTPQAELIDGKGRVVWSKLGEFRAADLAKLLAAIEKYGGQSVAMTNGGQ
jgi:hypothetical protein